METLSRICCGKRGQDGSAEGFNRAGRANVLAAPQAMMRGLPVQEVRKRAPSGLPLIRSALNDTGGQSGRCVAVARDEPGQQLQAVQHLGTLYAEIDQTGQLVHAKRGKFGEYR